MVTVSSNWSAEAGAVLRKDLLVEYRTRYALAAVVLFAITTLTAVSFAVGPGAQPAVQAALLWIVLYFAALTGLMRAFSAEEEGRTADLLRLSATPSAVFGGKLAFNLAILLALCALLVPGFAVLMSVRVADWALLLAILAAGCFALAAALTFCAALVAQAHARGALGAVVSFPLVAPLLKMAIDATRIALMGEPGGWPLVISVFALGGIVLVLAVLLFDSVWTA